MVSESTSGRAAVGRSAPAPPSSRGTRGGTAGGTAGGPRGGAPSSARGLVDSIPALQPALFGEVFVDLARHPVDAFRFFLPTPGALEAWREWANKGEVFLLVSQNASILGLPSSGPWPLQPFVARAYEQGGFQALWAIEGLGHAYADSVWELEGAPPRGLLTDPSLDDLPPSSLLMLHAGVGLAFAQRLLDAVGRRPAEAALAAAVDGVVDLCRASSLSGFVGAAYESCGLVARTFHPDLVQRIAAILRRRDPVIADYFWHGLGRALYFLPVNFLPCGEATWRAYRFAVEETPDERARANAIAGLTWATALVNQRQPAITAGLLRRHGREIDGLRGFSEGILGSTVMRSDTTPDAAFVREYCAYRPDDPELAALWRRLVGEPCLAGFDVRPRLAAAGRLDEVFRFLPLAELEGLR